MTTVNHYLRMARERRQTSTGSRTRPGIRGTWIAMSGVAVILVALLAQLDRFKFRFLTGRSAFFTKCVHFWNRSRGENQREITWRNRQRTYLGKARACIGSLNVHAYVVWWRRHAEGGERLIITRRRVRRRWIGQASRARSRLDWNRILQRSIHCKALGELCQIGVLLHFSRLNNLARSRPIFLRVVDIGTHCSIEDIENCIFDFCQCA